MAVFEIIATYKNTVMFYAMMIAIISSTAFLSYRRDRLGRYVWRKHWFRISFVIAVLFLGLASCGADYTSYERIFNSSIDPSYWSETRMEIGFLVFNIICKLIFQEYWIYHIIWAIVMLSLIYSTISKYRRIINPGFSILAYSCIFMIQSLDLMRINLAIAIVFFGIRYLIEKKYLKYIVTIFVAFLFHKSALCMYIPLFVILLFKNRTRYITKSIVLIGGSLIIIAIRDFLFNGKFLGYQYLSVDGSIGLAAFVYPAPIILTLLFVRNRNRKLLYDGFANSLITIFISSIAIHFISYFVNVFGRLMFYFTYQYMVLPYYLVSETFENGTIGTKKYNLYRKLWMVMFVFYFIFRAIMMCEFLETDGLEHYTNILGFMV